MAPQNEFAGFVQIKGDGNQFLEINSTSGTNSRVKLMALGDRLESQLQFAGEFSLVAKEAPFLDSRAAPEVKLLTLRQGGKLSLSGPDDMERLLFDGNTGSIYIGPSQGLPPDPAGERGLTQPGGKLILRDPVGNERVLLDGTKGNFGIGTVSPRSILEVAESSPGALGPSLTVSNRGGGQGAAAAIDFDTFTDSPSGAPSSRIVAVDKGGFANDVVFLSNRPGTPGNGLVERMRITPTGVGIGTTAPSTPLHVDGNATVIGNVGIGTNAPVSPLHVVGDVTVTGDVLLTGADCAEHFDVSHSEFPEPGTVVVIDEDGTLRESREAYDKKVAGVVSGAGDYKHGILLDNQPQKQRRVPVALVGKIYCKVDAQYSAIKVGDLLTTSPTPGHAMKATEPQNAFGSVIGKALTPFGKGRGLIPLVALQ